MATHHARHYATGAAIAVTIEGGLITAVTPSKQNPVAWIAPAFFDVQINGCLGIGFNSPTLTPEQVRKVAEVCRAHGIGTFYPTLVTNSFDAIRHGFETLQQAVEADADLKRGIPGYHLEGPYLSGEEGPRGAHPREHSRDPNWDEFRRWQDAAGGRIRMVTVAPERNGAIEFIAKLTATGVVVALGHTSATGDTIRAAVDAGAKTSTHLGNGSHAVLPRHDNYIWEQLAEDRLWMSVITDGHHLPAAVVRSLLRAKGISRTILTCDAGPLAGSPPGRYREWGIEMEVLPSGKTIVAGTPYLAGSGHFTDRCVSEVIRMAGVSLKDAIEMASLRPRELMGLPLPRIEAGEPSGLVLFNWQPGGEVKVSEIAD